MRFIKTILTSAGMLIASATTALAAPIALLQDPQSPMKVEVHTTEMHTVWYGNTMWLGIGCVVVLLVIVLAVLAARGREAGTSTTVIR